MAFAAFCSYAMIVSEYDPGMPGLLGLTFSYFASITEITHMGEHLTYWFPIISLLASRSCSPLPFLITNAQNAATLLRHNAWLREPHNAPGFSQVPVRYFRLSVSS